MVILEYAGFTVRVEAALAQSRVEHGGFGNACREWDPAWWRMALVARPWWTRRRWRRRPHRPALAALPRRRSLLCERRRCGVAGLSPPGAILCRTRRLSD